MVHNSLDAIGNVNYSLHMLDIRQTDDFAKWLFKLKDRAAKARIIERLDRASSGNLGNYKSLGAGLFELRLTYGPGYRLYFAREGDVIVVLLIGGDKSTQNRDIEKAREILKGLQQ